MIDPDELYFSSEKYRTLLDEIGEGIEKEEIEQRAGNSVEAAKYGLEVWDNLLKLMEMLRANSIYELSEQGVTIYDLLYWADCLSDELANASREDKSFRSKRLKFCESYVEMHQGLLDKDVGNLGNIRASLALSYYEMGEIKKADSLFREWLELEPDWGWGWIAWSDCFWLWKFLGLKTDLDKAEKILREGLSIPNVFHKDHVLERLQELLQEKKKAKLAQQSH